MRQFSRSIGFVRECEVPLEINTGGGLSFLNRADKVGGELNLYFLDVKTDVHVELRCDVNFDPRQ